MQDKFSYHDFIANIVPAIFLWWGLTLLPFFSAIDIFKNQNDILIAIVFVVIFYVFGLAVQFLATKVIERFIKEIYWDGKFYSEIFLIKSYNRIDDMTRNRLLKSVINNLKYSEEELAMLDIKKTEEAVKAVKLSQDIYFKTDAYTRANGLADKAHTQNSLYSLFRGLSFVCLIIALAFGITLITQNFYEPRSWLFLCIFILLTSFFVIRTRDTGERYIKGLFYSLPN